MQDIATDGEHEAWKTRAVGVREHEGSLRWTVQARSSDHELTVTVDTSRSGRVIDLQTSDGHIGTTGSDLLDEQVADRVADVLAQRALNLELDHIERPRQRSDRLRWAA
jgi:beta-galactosidase GanA